MCPTELAGLMRRQDQRETTRAFGADCVAILAITDVQAFSWFHAQALTEMKQPRGVGFKSIDLAVSGTGSGIRSKPERGKFLIDGIIREYTDFKAFTPDSIEKFRKTFGTALEQML